MLPLSVNAANANIDITTNTKTISKGDNLTVNVKVTSLQDNKKSKE